MPRWITVFPMIILGIIFFIGLLNAINPRMVWKISDSWKATKEPPKSYFIMRRIAGIFAMLVVVGIILFPYLMSKQ